MSSISVVIPVRNRPEVIHRALDSVFAQTYQPIEVIVVDDGSTDDTVASVEGRQNDPVKIIVLRHEKSKGAPAARNKGWRAAKGDLIAFLDSDDEWRINKLKEQVASLKNREKSPACFCLTSYHHLDGTTQKMLPTPEFPSLAELEMENLIGGTSTALIRRSALESVTGFDETLPSCQDWDLWLKLVKLGPLLVIQIEAMIYHYDGSGRISKNQESVIAGHRQILNSILSTYSDPRKRRALQAYHSYHFASIALHSLGSRWIAVKSCIMAIRFGSAGFKIKSIMKMARSIIWGQNPIPHRLKRISDYIK